MMKKTVVRNRNNDGGGENKKWGCYKANSIKLLGKNVAIVLLHALDSRWIFLLIYPITAHK
jgi:hypothetical protein